MKKILGFLLACVMVFGLTACGTGNRNEENVKGNAASTSEEKDFSLESQITTTEECSNSDSENIAEKNGGANTLVVYFSATGTTKKVAQTMAEAVSADLYEIIPVKPYTEDDLNYNDRSTRATVEQNDSTVRPEISGTVENWDQYDTVLIGYPIWWGEEPRIVDTFVESYDFTGKTVTVFCTSGGSSMGNSGKNLEKNAGNGTWLSGQKFQGSATVEDISSWISELGLN